MAIQIQIKDSILRKKSKSITMTKQKDFEYIRNRTISFLKQLDEFGDELILVRCINNDKTSIDR